MRKLQNVRGAKFLVTGAVIAGACLVIPFTSAGGLVPPDPTVVIDHVTICHATGAENKWVVQSPAATGDAGGHAGIGHQDGRDIIPPFTFSGGTFPGQNWDAQGQATYANGCELAEPTTPTTPPPPGAEVEAAEVQARFTG